MTIKGFLKNPTKRWRVTQSVGVWVIVFLSAQIAAADDGTTQLDGETHPFGSPQQVGFSAISSNPTLLTTEEYHAAYHAVCHAVSDLGTATKLGSLDARAASTLRASLLRLHDNSISQRVTKRLEDVLAHLEERYKPGAKPTDSDHRKLLTLLRKVFIYDAGFISGDFGFSSASNSNVGFGSLYFAGPEIGIDDDGKFRISAGISGAVLPTLSAGDHSVAYRVGGDILFGHPDSILATFSIGEYLNPDVRDLGIDISKRLCGPALSVDAKHGAAEHETELGPRTLYDHIRPGDTWLDLDGRNLSSQISGTAVEGGLTYCLPRRMALPGYPDLAPSITASVTYCAQQLGLNEGGLEMRVPFALQPFHTPLYLTARYGTRGDGSVEVAFKF